MNKIKCNCGSEFCENDEYGYSPFIHSKMIYESKHISIVEDTSSTKYNGLISVMDYDGNQYILTPISK